MEPDNKYADKADIALFYDIDVVSEITDMHMMMARMWVDSQIRYKGYTPTNYDDTYEELVAAFVYYIGELLANSGVITWQTGQIEEEQIGVMRRSFPRWQPMFFFSRGRADRFYDLLPHQTPLMKARQCIRRFWLTYDKDTVRTSVVVISDTSHRGWGWNYQPTAENERQNTENIGTNTTSGNEDQDDT